MEHIIIIYFSITGMRLSAYRLSTVGIFKPLHQLYIVCMLPRFKNSFMSFGVIPRLSMILWRLIPVSLRLIVGNIFSLKSASSSGSFLASATIIFCQTKNHSQWKIYKYNKKNNNESIIFDTKWKKLTNKTDIASGDIFQQYVYCKLFSAKKAFLIYPWYSSLDFGDVLLEESISDNDIVLLKASPYNIKGEDTSLGIIFWKWRS